MTRRKLLMSAVGAGVVLVLAAAGYGLVQSRSQSILDTKHPLPASAVRALATPEDLAAGRQLTASIGCGLCHGRDFAGPKPGAFVAKRLQAPNLTRVVATRTDAELDRAIRHGLNPDGTSEMAMPSYAYAQLTDREVGQMIGYLRSLAPIGGEVRPPAPTLGLRFNLATGNVKTQVERRAAAKPAMDLGPALEPGRHLAVAACGQCHGPDLAGGRRFPAPDLTVRHYYSREQFHGLMEDGVVLQGSSELMQAAARSGFTNLTPAQVDAIYDYLLARDVKLASRPAP